MRLKKVDSSTNITQLNMSNFQCAGAPGNTLVTQGLMIGIANTLFDNINNNAYQIISFDGPDMSDPNNWVFSNVVLQKFITDANIVSAVPYIVWSTNSQSLAFNTPRTPSATNNITVIASFSQTSTLLTASVVQVQLNVIGSWVTIASPSISGLAATATNTVTFDVPKGAQYRYISVSGTNSVVSNFETVK